MRRWHVTLIVEDRGGVPPRPDGFLSKDRIVQALRIGLLNDALQYDTCIIAQIKD